ncbi:hypothetical protein WJX75_004501 [Coccomyxa subellipsoidea]|uniref:Uncharacterized protein n=1 Tax=Coccomyxa subellipsoidea TaxID=248742 RepID=A0ABR2YZS6_9CHLO
MSACTDSGRSAVVVAKRGANRGDTNLADNSHSKPKSRRMARIGAFMAFICLGALATIEARHLLLNTASYSDNMPMPGTSSSYQATGGTTAASDTLPAIQLPTLSQIKSFFDAFPGPNIFDALAPALAPAPAADMAAAPIGAAMAPSTMATQT